MATQQRRTRRVAKHATPRAHALITTDPLRVSLQRIRDAAAQHIRQLGQDPAASTLTDPRGLVQDCTEWFRADVVERFGSLAAQIEQVIREAREHTGLPETAVPEALRLNALDEEDAAQLERHLDFLAGIMHVAEIAQRPEVARDAGRALAIGAVLGQRITVEMYRPIIEDALQGTRGADAARALQSAVALQNQRSKAGRVTVERARRRKHFHAEMTRWLLNGIPGAKTEEITQAILGACPKGSDHARCTWRQVRDQVLEIKRERKNTVS